MALTTAEARILQEGTAYELAALRTDNPAIAPAHLFHGIKLLDAGDTAAALDALDAALAVQPRNTLALSYRGLALLALGRDAEARELFAAEGFSDNRGFMARLTEWAEGQWLAHNRFFEGRELPPAITADPAAARLSRRKAERLATKAFHKRDWPELVRVLASLAETDAPDPGVAVAYAIGCEMLGDYDRALQCLERLGEQVESDDFGPAVRGRLLLRLRRYREAAHDLGSVMIMGAEDYGVNYALAVLCLACGDAAHARSLFLRAYQTHFVDTLEFQYAQITRAILNSR